jgi:hypothetical protein
VQAGLAAAEHPLPLVVDVGDALRQAGELRRVALVHPQVRDALARQRDEAVLVLAQEVARGAGGPGVVRRKPAKASCSSTSERLTTARSSSSATTSGVAALRVSARSAVPRKSSASVGSSGFSCCR